MKDFVKQWAWTILAGLFFILYLGQGCSNKSIKKVNSNVVNYNDSLIKAVNILSHRVDSLEKSTLTGGKVIDNMERTMLDFLIYEDDLDKGKISLSQIKNKIEENDVD